MVKMMKYCVLLIPVTFAVFAAAGFDFYSSMQASRFRAGVSLSCAIILWITHMTTGHRSIRWVIASLLVSIVADWFMMRSGRIPVYFLYGIVLFFVAHVGFIIFCLKNGRVNYRWLWPVLSGYSGFFALVLLPAITQPVLLVAVLAYLLASCFSLACAAGLRLSAVAHWGFTAGIALLVFSDTLIALNVFAGYGGGNFLILPTYFASHIVITVALMDKKLRS